MDSYLLVILLTIIMGQYRITSAIRDKKGVLLQVCVGGGINTVEKIHNMLNKGRYSFYTLEKGIKAVVYTGVTSTGRLFITTNSDGVTENNLGELKSHKI